MTDREAMNLPPMPEPDRRDGETDEFGPWFSAAQLRDYGAACYAAGMEAAAKLCDELRARESAGAAHHAGSWQSAFEHHTTRHAALVDARDAIRAAKETT